MDVLRRAAVALVLTAAGALPVAAVVFDADIGAAAAGGISDSRGEALLLLVLCLPAALAAALGPLAFDTSRTQASLAGLAVAFGSLLAMLLAIAAAAIATCESGDVVELGRSHALAVGGAVYTLAGLGLAWSPQWLRRFWPLAVGLATVAAAVASVAAHPCVGPS